MLHQEADHQLHWFSALYLLPYQIQCIGQSKLLNSAQLCHLSNIKRQSALLNEDINGKVWLFWLNIFWFSKSSSVCWRHWIQNCLLCFWGTGLWFHGHPVFVQKLLSSFESCISIIIFPANWYTSLNIHFLLSQNISSYNISIGSSWAANSHWVTVASQELHVTLLALPHLLWTQILELVKAPNDCSIEVNNFRTLCLGIFFMIGILKLIFDCK